MPICVPSLGSRIRSWLRNYECLQSLALLLLYIQIACSLVGGLGALFNGVLVINLAVSLFALVAIESSSQSLGRVYAVLLFCSVLLDVAWLVMFSTTIWNMTPDQNFGPQFVFSLRLTLSMEITGFIVRIFSSFLWIQMYRLGISATDSLIFRATYNDARNSFVSRSVREVARENSISDEILGGAIYDPAYYASLFEESRDKVIQPIPEGDDGHSESVDESPQLKTHGSRSF